MVCKDTQVRAGILDFRARKEIPGRWARKVTKALQVHADQPAIPGFQETQDHAGPLGKWDPQVFKAHKETKVKPD